MPRVHTPSSNGKPHDHSSPPPGMGEEFRQHFKSRQSPSPNDEKGIGSDRYTPSPDDYSATFEDLDRAISNLRWLIDDWVPAGMLTGLVAEPKAGKSFFALYALALPLMTGRRFFTGQEAPEAGHVIYCDTERSAAININRVRAWGAPKGHLVLPFKDEWEAINIDNPAHLDRLFKLVCCYKARAVIIDSFRGAHDSDENNSRIQKPLRDLGAIAEETGTGILINHHTGKIEVDKDLTINCGRGSNAFLAAVRAQIVIERPDPDSDWRRVQVLGENIGTKPAPVGFRITSNGLVFGPAPGRPRKRTESDFIEEWLRSRLQPGVAHKAGELLEEGDQRGYAKRTVQRVASEVLGINPTQTKDGWVWVLPL